MVSQIPELSSIVKFEDAYQGFRECTSFGRKKEFPKLEKICNEIRYASDDAYLRECCVRFLETCKNLSKERQPLEYDEEGDLAYALGQLRLICDCLQSNLRQDQQ